MTRMTVKNASLIACTLVLGFVLFGVAGPDPATWSVGGGATTVDQEIREDSADAPGGSSTARSNTSVALSIATLSAKVGDYTKCSRSSEMPSSDAAPADTCSSEPSQPGCAQCSKIRNSWVPQNPWGVSEFSINARVKSKSFVPIFKDLDAEVRSVGGKRVVLDVGFTGFGDLEWISQVYSTSDVPSTSGTPATSVYSFEPNPTTHAHIQEQLRTTEKAVRTRVKHSLFNRGIGEKDGRMMFWFNKEQDKSSFQRVRGDDYEQVPTMQNCSRLDSLFKDHPEVVVPFLKVSAGRWEHYVLKSGDKLFDRVAVVMVDITPMPNNAHIVETLAARGFTVYALGCGSLARIHQNRPWWWSPIVAVKGFLVPVAESYTCFDFSTSPYICDYPQSPEKSPGSCRLENATAPVEELTSEFDPVQTTKMASPEVHWRLKVVFLTFIFVTVALLAVNVAYPLGLAVWDNFVRTKEKDGRATPPL